MGSQYLFESEQIVLRQQELLHALDRAPRVAAALASFSIVSYSWLVLLRRVD